LKEEIRIKQQEILQKQYRRLKSRAGFTLIEVIAVTAMLGVLAAMLMPSISGANDRTKNAKMMNDLATLDQAIQVYRLDKGTPPNELKDLVDEYVARNDGFKDATGTEFKYTVTETTKYKLNGKNTKGDIVKSYGSADYEAKASGTTPDPKPDQTPGV
jgi:general secretion pathway protein G